MPSSEVMGKFKKGKLKSGGKKGPKVKDRKQAVAIMMNEKKNEAKNGGTYADKATATDRMKGKKKRGKK